MSIQSTPANKSGVTAGKKTSDNITSLALTRILIIAKKVPNVDNPKDIIIANNKYSILSILILNRIDVIGNAKIDEIRTSIKLLVNLPKKIISLDIGDKINASNAPFSRIEIVKHLESHGIQTRPVFTGNVLRQPAFEKINYKNIEKEYDVANNIMKNQIKY